MKKIIQIIAIILFGYLSSRSQDLRSAYLHYKWVNGTTYDFELKLYTQASVNISRPTATINFGDATGGNMVLTSSVVVNGVAVRIYTISHTYPGIGQYYPAFQDTFRVANIKNIVNSQLQTITSEAYINISNLTIHNTAPFMQNHPVYFQLQGNNVCYDPDFFDVEGDSISYFLANCCTVGYYIPTGTALTYNGTLCFSKDSIGLYAFAYIVREWRKDFNNNYYIIGHSQVDYVMNITNDVGLPEIVMNSSKLKIYPNPVSNILTIEGVENCDIEIINILGQKEKRTLHQNNINVSGLPAGTYFIKTPSGYSKFIKE